jgi:excisionase family DNA binding protein
MSERMLTPNEVAERLGVAPKTVRALIHGRHLDACNVTPNGRPTYRIEPAAVEKFRQQNQAERPQEPRRRHSSKTYDRVISYV